MSMVQRLKKHWFMREPLTATQQSAWTLNVQFKLDPYSFSPSTVQNDTVGDIPA